MQCINCGSQLEHNWTHCPYCGKFKSVLKETVTTEDVDSIFGKMMGPESAKSVKAKDSYGSGVRGQVLEVIVRQAMAGAPWRQICEGPMAVNKITVEEVMAEVERRRQILNPSAFKKAKEEKAKKDKESKEFKTTKDSKDLKDAKDSTSTPPRPQPFSNKPELVATATQRLQKLYKQLEEFLENAINDKGQKECSDTMMAELKEIINSVMRLETILYTIREDIAVATDLERELGRTRKPFDLDQHGDPHRIDW